MKSRNQVNRIAHVATIALLTIALVAPIALAQDGAGAPMSAPSAVPSMTEGTVGNSIRQDSSSGAPAPAAEPASGDDLSGDSISVTGGVPGSPPSSGSASAPASAPAPAEASAPAPAEQNAPAPAEASAPAPPAPAEASAPAPPAPAVASAPAPPVTASEPAPAAVPSIAPAPEAAAASASTPVTTAAMPPAGALAPPMVMAPVPADAPPVPGPSPDTSTAADQTAPPKQSRQTAGKTNKGEGTKVASNEPNESNPTGLQFGNNKGPIHIKSESMSLDYQNHSVLWTGHVHATQDQAQLTSDQLRVNYFDKDFKQLKDMVADGNVRMSQGTQWATGEHGVMDQTKRTMVLTGSPVVHDCANQITGKRITVFLDTNKSVVEDARAVIFPRNGKGADDAPPAPGCQ